MGEAILFGRGKLVLYDPVFANNSWEDIIAYCQRGTVPEEWAVGDQKAMTINGTKYLIDIIGRDHDDYADGSGKAPLTFQLHDGYATCYQMNSSNTNVGGWTNCAMRNTHLPTILALMPTEVQNAIREVSKLTSAGNTIKTINTTADKLFLLSEEEILGYYSYSVDGEGEQYPYYSDSSKRIKYYNNSAMNWFTRSPHSGVNSYFCRITSGGSGAYTDANSTTSYACPAFCF